MSKSKTFIEKAAIHALEAIFLSTKRINFNINSGDKGISWDGKIELFPSEADLDTKNLIGRIPIQVKGISIESPGNSEISYPVDIRDLINYRNDGGCLFFVICLYPNNVSEVFYNALLPYDLNKILDKIDQQKTKSLKFKKIPTEPSILVSLLKSFLDNRKKQISTADIKLGFKVLNQEQLDNIENYTFTLQGTKQNPFSSMFDIPTYVYAKTKLGVPVPIEKLECIEKVVVGDISATVYFNEKDYHNKIRIGSTKNTDTIEIGEGIVIDTSKGMIQYNENGSLNTRIEDLQLWLDLCQNPKKKLKINKFFTGKVGVCSTAYEILNMSRYIKQLESIRTTLDYFGINSDLDYEKLTDEDFKKLWILTKASEGHKLSFETEPPILGIMTISNLNIALHIFKTDDGEYTVESFLTLNDAGFYVETTEGVKNEASHFIILKKHDLLKISNTNYDIMLKSIISKQYAPLYTTQLTGFLLEALKAYDESKNPELLNFIEKTFLWQNENESLPIHTLNYIQTVKRKRELNEEEIKNLINIKISTDDNMIILGTCILLESYKEANQYWDRLSPEQKEGFSGFPIFHLWNGEKPIPIINRALL